MMSISGMQDELDHWRKKSYNQSHTIFKLESELAAMKKSYARLWKDLHEFRPRLENSQEFIDGFRYMKRNAIDFVKNRLEALSTRSSK